MRHTDSPYVWNDGGGGASCYPVGTGQRVKKLGLKKRGDVSNYGLSNFEEVTQINRDTIPQFVPASGKVYGR
jgi:hypothetical protein